MTHVDHAPAGATTPPKPKPAPKFVDPTTIDTRFYGHLLLGSCLYPEFKDGDKVVFDRDAPLENGCFAVCYYRPELVSPGRHSAQLKRLVIAPAPWVKFPWKDHPKSEVVPVIIVEQLNPALQWSVKCSDLLAVHRCLGSMSDPAVQKQLEAEGYRI